MSFRENPVTCRRRNERVCEAGTRHSTENDFVFPRNTSCNKGELNQSYVNLKRSMGPEKPRVIRLDREARETWCMLFGQNEERDESVSEN